MKKKEEGVVERSFGLRGVSPEEKHIVENVPTNSGRSLYKEWRAPFILHLYNREKHFQKFLLLK